MKCKLAREMDCKPCKEFPKGKKPADTIIDHPDAWKLVQMGDAYPADEACRKRAGLSDEEIDRRIKAKLKIALGIAPDDYGRFDAGEILGYNPDGTDIPGPNYIEPVESDLFDGEEEESAG